MMTRTSHTDSRLCWTMRIVGLLLSATCLFLLTTDLIRTQETIAFLIIGTALGAVTFIASWFSAPQAPAPEPVRARS